LRKSLAAVRRRALSDPYVGLFRMRQDIFDGLLKTLAATERGVSPEEAAQSGGWLARTATARRLGPRPRAG